MTVTTDYSPNVSTANGVTVAFPFDFLILAASDLKVTVRDLDGIETVLALGVDYTVSGVGNPAGGVATLVVPPANQHTVIRERAIPYRRASDYQELGDLTAQALNRDFDLPILLLQQVLAQLENVLRFATGQTISPLPVLVPGGYLRVNATGDGFVFPETVEFDPGTVASAYGSTFVESADAAAAKNLLQLGAFSVNWNELLADTIIGRTTGNGAAQLIGCNSIGRGLLNPASKAALRTYLELGTLATLDQADVAGVTQFTRLAEKRQQVTHNASGALVINLALGHVIELSQSANITSLAFTNPPASGWAATVTILRKKDNSGTARTISWGDGSTTFFKWPNGGTPPSLTQTANAEDLFTLVCFDGQNWRGGAGLNYL